MVYLSFSFQILFGFFGFGFFPFFFSRFSWWRPGSPWTFDQKLCRTPFKLSIPCYSALVRRVLRCQTTHTANACCSLLGFWVLVVFSFANVAQLSEKEVLSFLFALLDRVRCATCVSNSRVALANVLRPLCLFLISLYLHQSFFFFFETQK